MAPEDEDLRQRIQRAGAVSPGSVPGNLASMLHSSVYSPAERRVVVNDVFPAGQETAFKLAFIGSGQGGSRMAHAYWKLGYQRVCCFNTTDQDNEGIDPVIPLLSLDVGGAGKDMQLARNAMRGREEEVWDLLQRAWGNEVDYALVCVGLGGGTGSGTALPLVKTIRRYLESKGKTTQRVGCVVSLPRVGDGQQVCRNAVTAFRELAAASLSPLVVIDNGRVHELYCPPMAELLPKSNILVSNLLHLFNRLAGLKSQHVTFDRAELGQLLDGGLTVLSAADIPVETLRSPADVSTRIRNQLANNVLARVDLRRGKKAACVFVGHASVLGTFSADFFDAGFSQLDRIVGADLTGPAADGVVVHRGVYCGDDPGLQCYTLVSGLEPPHERLAELAKIGGLSRIADASRGPGAHLGVE